MARTWARTCITPGTVGAAREAVIHHVHGLAVSLCSKKVNADFAPTARLAKQAAELILSEGLPEQVLLNINVPESWKGAVRLTRQSKKITRTVLREGEDPRGSRYFWLSEAAHRRGYGSGRRFGLRGDFCGRGVHNAVAPGPDTRGVVEPFIALGVKIRAIVARLAALAIPERSHSEQKTASRRRV